DLFVLQYTLLTVGLSVAVVSCALATYQWSLPRRLFHLSLFCILLELFYRIAYGGAVSSGVVLSMPETSGRETAELLAGHALLTMSLSLVALLTLYALVVSWKSNIRFSLRRCIQVGAVCVSMILASIALAGLRFADAGLLKQTVIAQAESAFPFDVAKAFGAVAI